jgi:hypothetical protein
MSTLKRALKRHAELEGAFTSYLEMVKKGTSFLGGCVIFAIMLVGYIGWALLQLAFWLAAGSIFAIGLMRVFPEIEEFLRTLAGL